MFSAAPNSTGNATINSPLLLRPNSSSRISSSTQGGSCLYGQELNGPTGSQWGHRAVLSVF